MHRAEHVADLVQVVLGPQPSARDESVVVGATLAVDEHELDGGRGGELAEGGGWPRRWATSMVLPKPASPPTTDPETSARRTKIAVPSSAQPSHQASRDAGAVPERSICAAVSSGSRCSPRRRISPGPCCSARTLTHPQVSAR